MAWDIPLTEFDADRAALIETELRSTSGEILEREVICFFRDVIDEVCGDGRAEGVATFTWEHGVHQLFSLQVRDSRVAVFQPGVGAPLACGLFEQAIAAGCRKFVACGGAGAVVPGLALGHAIVPDAAGRDKDTSHHYLPPSREVSADPAATSVLCVVLDERAVPYEVGKTWTTDAPYRETQAKVAARRREGCITVEMETAAFLAVARHRDVTFGQYLYAGDDVSGQTWDHRQWHTSSARSDPVLAVRGSRPPVPLTTAAL